MRAMAPAILIGGVLLVTGCPPSGPPVRRPTPRPDVARRRAPPPPRPEIARPARPLEPLATWKAYFTVRRGKKAVGRAYLGFERNDEGARYEVRRSVETSWGRITHHVNLQVDDSQRLKWLRAIEMEQVSNTTLRMFTRYEVKPVAVGVAVTTTRFGHRWTRKVAAVGAWPLARYPLLAAYFLARKQGRQENPALNGVAVDPRTVKAYPFSFGGTVREDRARFQLTLEELGALQIDYDVAWGKLHGVKGTGKLYSFVRGGKPPSLIRPPAGFQKARDVTLFRWPAALKQEPLAIPAAEGRKLRARLSLPARGRRWPVVVLVPAADTKDMDGTRGLRKLYAELAALLGGAGYAVLRYAPRGVPPTGGERGKAGLADHLGDLRAIVDRLRRDRRLDRRQVFLLGHAEGGMVALRYAATRPQELRGLLLVSTPGVEYQAYILDQWRRRWETAGMPLRIVNRRIAWFEAQLKKTAKGARKDLLGRPGGYVADLLKIDPLRDYRRVRLRTLILAGDADVTVRTDDVNALRAGMPRNRRLTIARPKSVGHLLQHSPRFLELSEMWKIPAPIAPAARQALLGWLKKNAR